MEDVVHEWRMSNIFWLEVTATAQKVKNKKKINKKEKKTRLPFGLAKVSMVLL